MKNEKNNVCFVSFIFLVLLILPLISSLDSELIMSCGGDEELIIGCPISDEQLIFLGGISGVTEGDTVDVGGGGSAIKVECYSSSDCAKDEYCFENKCYDSECSDDSVCKVEEGERCWDNRCVKLFDIEILKFESPAKLGEFFEFTYFMKGMAKVEGDVEINFWIERDGKIVTSGSDVIYMGTFEEKTKTKKLFLSNDVDSGTYEFIIQLKFETYTVKAHRTIGIVVADGAAHIILAPKIKDIQGYVIAVLIVLLVFVLFLVFYLERKKIKK